MRPMALPARSSIALLLLACSLGAAGCNRNIEPYDPDEKVSQPDLAKIFPEGAEAAADARPPIMPSGEPSATGGRGAPAFAAAGGSAESLRGQVMLDPSLEGQVPASAVLFLIARTGQGGPPTAVKRIPSPRFPLAFEIGPGDRMIQSLPWAGPFQIQARIDADGNATTREAGDLASDPTGPHAPGSSGIEVQLDQVL